MSRKYNPCLKGMVDNYRARLKEDGISTQEMTDEQLYQVIDNCAGFSTSEEQYEAIKEDITFSKVPNYPAKP